MRRFLPHLWAGTGLLAALLMCSCQHNRCNCQQNRCCCKGKCSTAASPGPPLASAARPVLAVKAPAAAMAVNMPAAPSSPPVVYTAAKLNPTASEKSQDPPPSLNGRNEDGPTQPTELLGHDPKYRWLVGTLEYSQIQRAWLLRYVSYEEDDRYGGCVTLVGALPTNALKAGKTVRVEGNLIDPDSRQLRPAFQVENLRACW